MSTKTREALEALVIPVETFLPVVAVPYTPETLVSVVDGLLGTGAFARSTMTTRGHFLHAERPKRGQDDPNPRAVDLFPEVEREAATLFLTGTVVVTGPVSGNPLGMVGGTVFSPVSDEVWGVLKPVR